MVRDHLYPVDKLEHLHTKDDCWCYPIDMNDAVVHRFAEFIDTLGKEREFITGYVYFHGRR